MDELLISKCFVTHEQAKIGDKNERHVMTTSKLELILELLMLLDDTSCGRTEETVEYPSHTCSRSNYVKTRLRWNNKKGLLAGLIMLSTHPSFLRNNGRLSIFWEVKLPIMHNWSIIIRRTLWVYAIWLLEISFGTWKETQKVWMMLLFLSNLVGFIIITYLAKVDRSA